MEQGRKLNEYDALRVIATILVVFGHSQVFQSANFSFVLPSNTVRTVLDVIIRYIYTFHVPLFFFVSGAVFCISTKRGGKYGRFFSLVATKAKRLLIPYVLTFVLLLLPLRILLGNYSSVIEVVWDLIGLGDAGHLWFLPVLFLSFLLFSLMQKILRRDWLVGGGALFLYGFALLVPDRYDIVLRYFIWFAAGYFFEKIKPRIKIKIEQYAIVFWSVFLGLFIVLNVIPGTSYALMKFLQDVMITTTGILQAYFFAIVLVHFHVFEKISFLRVISKYSFAIYLYHDVFNFLILFIFHLLFDLSRISLVIYIILLLCKTIGVLLASIGFSSLLQKGKCFFHVMKEKRNI